MSDVSIPSSECESLGKYRSLDESYKHLLVSRDRIKNELLAVYAR